jgi:hypothetical protein
MGKLTKGLLALVVLASVASVPSYAYIIGDGSISDIAGVTPFSDWSPSNPNVDWAGGGAELNKGGVNNTSVLADFGGPHFDDSASNVYFALVTSFPQAGVLKDGVLYRPGDIAINLYGSNFDYGVKTNTLSGFGNVGDVYATTPGNWVLPHGSTGFPTNGPSEFVGGSLLGNIGAQFAYTELAGFPSNGVPTYAIPKSWLGNPGVGEDITLRWTMSCGNDDIGIKGDIDTPPLPEPASMLLMGAGLMGAAFFRKKKTSV